jgi:Transposase DDE domain
MDLWNRQKTLMPNVAKIRPPLECKCDFSPARQSARELVTTPEFAKAQRQRKKVEALFAELKNQIGLRRLRLRRLKFVREQFFQAATVQNIKRLVRFLGQPMRQVLAATV